jgi:redox-sensitive bicupin YhaK (pirin superfamily)
MIIRRASTRGFVKNSWIESRRTFSNNQYFNPEYMKWGNLRVVNDDLQQPGNMVPNHEHKNFDILGYMVTGELDHWDSTGIQNRARAGQVQHMWCGSSIWHTEASVGSEPARYLQIWILPKDQYRDSEPYYEVIDRPENFSRLNIDLKQDMQIHCGWVRELKTLNIQNKAYLYVVEGSIKGNDFELNEGDGAELTGDLSADFDAHIILFEE